MSPDDQARMGAIWDALHMAYPGSFKALFAATEQETRKHQAHWLGVIREVGLTGTEIKAGLQRIAEGNRPLDAKGKKPSNAFPPSLPEFIEIARPDRNLLGHASRRPVDQVLLEQTGAKAHRLLPETAEGKSRRKTAGNAALAALKGSF